MNGIRCIGLILIISLVVPWMGFSQEEVGPEWTKDFEKKIADYAISNDGNYVVVGTVPGNLYFLIQPIKGSPPSSDSL
jgi:hypothetical protein